MTYANKKYIDILKIIATLLVLLGHLVRIFHITIFYDDTYFFYIQYYGVVIFLFVSGFLLVESLRKNGFQMKAKDYFIHRNKNTYVLYLCAIFFVMIVDTILLHVEGGHYVNGYNSWVQTSDFAGYSVGAFIITALYLSLGSTLKSFCGITIPDVNEFGSAAQLWYMSAWFWISLYVIAIWYFIIVPIKKHGKVPIWGFLLIVLFSCAIYLNLICHPAFHSVFPIFIMGCLCGLLYRKIKFKGNKCIAVALVSLAISISIMVYTRDAYNLMGALFSAFSFLLLNVYFYNKDYGRNNNIFFKQRLSKFSLPIYLTHHTIFIWICVIFGDGYKTALFALITSITVAVIFKLFTDKTVNIINRIERRNPTPLHDHTEA